MNISVKNKVSIVIISAFALLMTQSFVSGSKDDDHEKPKNLKVLPKNMTGDELHQVMREYSKSLGVKCGFCHVSTGEGEQREWDFASDAKKHKLIARNMIKMTDNINKKYISKMETHGLNKISCVTCHMGNPIPMMSVDSLPKKP